VSAARVARWVWGPGTLPRAARASLVPWSLGYDALMALRTAAYRTGLFRTQTLPGPAVAVGNLGVGGAGKTPVSAWIAQHYAERGRTPAILLRGYGGDEPRVLARLVPNAVVVANPDRVAGAREAVRLGADIFVLDDAFQLLKVARDLNIALLAAEQKEGWRLPAGPWREPWGALGRADAIVVTRKQATRERAAEIADRLAQRWPRAMVAIAHLGLERFEGLDSHAEHAGRDLRGRRVVAAAGVFDPESFAAQLRELGADVHLVAYEDHHPFPPGDVERLAQAAAGADYVVVTEKDAVKLRGRLKLDRGTGEPLVALLAVHWEQGLPELSDALLALERSR